MCSALNRTVSISRIYKKVSVTSRTSCKRSFLTFQSFSNKAQHFVFLVEVLKRAIEFESLLKKCSTVLHEHFNRQKWVFQSKKQTSIETTTNTTKWEIATTDKRNHNLSGVHLTFTVCIGASFLNYFFSDFCCCLCLVWKRFIVLLFNGFTALEDKS